MPITAYSDSRDASPRVPSRCIPVIVCLLSLVPQLAIAGQDIPFHDWNRVTFLEAGRLVTVKPFKGEGRRAKGTFVRANDESVVLQTQNGEVALDREKVRQVVARRLGWGKAGWIGAGIGFGILAATTVGDSDFSQPAAGLFFGGIGAGIGGLAGLGVRAVARHQIVYEAKRPDSFSKKQ